MFSCFANSNFILVRGYRYFYFRVSNILDIFLPSASLNRHELYSQVPPIGPKGGDLEKFPHDFLHGPLARRTLRSATVFTMRINSAGVEGWVTGYRFGLFGQRGKGAIHDNRFGWEIKKLIKDRVLLSCFPFHQRSVSNRCRIGSHRIGSSTIRSVDVSFYSRLLSSFSSFTYRPSREKEPVAR